MIGGLHVHPIQLAGCEVGLHGSTHLHLSLIVSVAAGEFRVTLSEDGLPIGPEVTIETLCAGEHC